MNAATLRVLIEKGLSPEDILAVAEAMESKKDNTAAERQARHRAKKRGESNGVTSRRDPLNDSDLNPGSVVSPDGEKQNKPRKQRGSACPRPDDIPEQLWGDWVAHRAKHRADAGQTTIDAYRREAEGVGWSLEQALTEQISRGWRGFKAKWVTDDDRPAPRLQPANDFRSVRGSRPNPALDMVLQAERELQAEAVRQNPGPDWPTWPALPSGQPS